MFDGKTRVVSISWNDNLLVIFGAKLSFKYQSLSIVSVGGLIRNMYRDLMSSLRHKNNIMVYELLKFLIFKTFFLKKGKLFGKMLLKLFTTI